MQLGLELLRRRPDKFAEILHVLRETVGVYQILERHRWLIRTNEGRLLDPKS